ncbi:MAG: type II toxin-antitoxin system RelE/ParE family toxin [Synergistaceae bacterium]|jgi:mRNA interferase RelE/StbE|nr:type II toxin-antitoxin system RelE/ParE family toxin [Synergistaceae bacterium]
MAHSIEFKLSVRKQIASLPQVQAGRIIQSALALADNPRPVGCKKLKGSDSWRIRVGDYRVVYEIYDDVLVVLVVRVAHRREVYKS